MNEPLCFMLFMIFFLSSLFGHIDVTFGLHFMFKGHFGLYIEHVFRWKLILSVERK
jgi:hypothetical protein